MYRAIVFSRVSSEHQDLVQQTDEVFAEAVKNGFDKSEIIFIEQKESAIKLDEEERIGLQQLKESIEKHPIECVFVYEISRISRRPKVIYSIRDLLIERQIQLVCIKPYLKLLEDGKLSQTASIMFSIFASLSESEMMLKKERMQRGVRHARAMGKHAGGAIMFGYKTTKDHYYVIDEQEATIVKRIFNEYVYGNKSMRILTRDLQEEGFFKGIKYLTAVQNVYNILHHDCYCGRKKGMPAIISESLYDKSVEKRKASELKVNHTDNMALCKGILRDANTGLLLSSNTGANMYYSKRHSGVAVGMHIIEPVIWKEAVELHKSLAIKGIKSLEAKMGKRIHTIYMIRGNQVKKQEEIREKMDKLEERIVLGKISEKKAEEIEKMLESELKEIDNRARELNKELADLVRKITNIKATGDAKTDYDNMSKEERYDVVHAVIDKVILRRESRYLLECTIYNKVYEWTKTIKIDTYKKRLVN